MSTFVPGAWKVCCDRCGKTLKSYQLKKEWNGLRTCSTCWRPRHPQDLMRGRTDPQAPPWVRPEPSEIDVSVGSGNEVSGDDL